MSSVEILSVTDLGLVCSESLQVTEQPNAMPDEFALIESVLSQLRI